MVKLVFGVALGVLLAVVVVVGVREAMVPRDCGLQGLEVASGDRAEVDQSCR